MGQQKGNPTPSYQNQAYETLRPNNGARENRDYGTKPVMIDDNTTLTKLLNDQQIFPTNYLCSLLYGQDGSYKPHSDKHRLLSIMYLKTDEPATTNFYESKIGRKKGFYEFDEVDLLEEKVIERKDFTEKRNNNIYYRFIFNKI